MAAARRRIAASLAAAGVATAGLDARILLEGALSVPDLIGVDPARALGAEERARVASHLARRLAGEPVFRILGEREFWGLPFRLSRATLEPRPDSETLVEAALAALAERRAAPLRLLDLGTGTGCILVALLGEFPNAAGTGVDLSADACAAAAANAARNGVADRATILQADWTGGVDGRFDLIVSNPPYVATAEIASLDSSVRDHDPLLALDGGADGLDAYRRLAAALPSVLAAGGLVILEAGAGQANEIAALMDAAGFSPRGVRRDLGGHERALLFALPS